MDFVWSAFKILAGGFMLFTIARVTYGLLVPRAGWLWVMIAVLLALANMFGHRWLGSSINPPFFTAVLLAVTLFGLGPSETKIVGNATGASKWSRRGAGGVVAGTLLGWMAYAEVIQI
jgi:hypothetical protein